jgi:hypothetical protein
MRRISSRWTPIAILATALVATACSDTVAPTVGADPSAAGALGSAATPSSALDQVSRALAMSLERPEARKAVRDAMRASTLNEHKLELQPFLATPGGQTVLAAMAAESGTPRAELEAAVAGLPLLDFYVPVGEQRRQWRATGNVAVVGTLAPVSAPYPAYGTDGERFGLDAAEGRKGTVLVALHPAEPKAEREDVRTVGAGEVIQDAGERDAATARGRSPKEPAEGGSVIASVPGQVYVQNMYTVYACDYFCQDPVFGGSDQLELEFKTWIGGVERKTYWYGVPTNGRWEYGINGWTGLTIRTDAPGYFENISVQIWESDNGGDDQWIALTRTGSQFPTPLGGGGNYRCNPDGTTAYAEWPCQFYVWREINAQFAIR